jgi:hypothetical protein
MPNKRVSPLMLSFIIVFFRNSKFADYACEPHCLFSDDVQELSYNVSYEVIICYIITSSHQIHIALIHFFLSQTNNKTIAAQRIRSGRHTYTETTRNTNDKCNGKKEEEIHRVTVLSNPALCCVCAGQASPRHANKTLNISILSPFGEDWSRRWILRREQSGGSSTSSRFSPLIQHLPFLLPPSISPPPLQLPRRPWLC